MQNGNPKVLSAGSLSKDKVQNLSGESLGDIEDLMIDLGTGRVAYAVLSFGGVLGMGNKLFAIPWQAMNLDTDNQVFLLDVNKESLEQAPWGEELPKRHWSPDFPLSYWTHRRNWP